MTLEAATVRLLNMSAGLSEDPGGDGGIGRLRAQDEAAQLHWDVPQVDVWKEEQRCIDGPHGDIALRLYWPVTARSLNNLGLLVAYHGGGWVMGSLDTYDNFCRYLCKYGEAIIISVEYRLAPEHKFPVAVDDSYAALNWVAGNAVALGGDVTRLCVGGDSAGGNLAAVMCHLASMNKGPNISRQLLFYPCLAMYDDHGYVSRREYGVGDYGLSEAQLLYCRDLYAGSAADHRDIRISPILAESFAGLPAALIIMPEYDPLRDEGEDYAAKLEAAGVDVEYRLYPGVVHGFMSQSGIVGIGLEALNAAAAYLHRA